MKRFSDRARLAMAFASAIVAGSGAEAFAQGGGVAMQAAATSDMSDTVVVTARLREENPQDIPMALSVVNGETIARSNTNNVSQISQLVPALNYSSANPRNTSYTIRGLGSSVVAIAQANDGLEPGVGFYVDQVYHGRPASAAFDFNDLERVEVLRGPQGTLFGKNTTAGAIRLSTRAPTFDPHVQAEVSRGELGYQQAKVSLSGPLAGDFIAGRLSGAVTLRDGYLHNVTTGQDNNDLGAFAVRGQLLFAFNDDLSLRLSADMSKIDATCCTQAYFGVGTTLKPAARQYPALAAGVNYAPASTNPYDRLVDINAGLGIDTLDGGVQAIADWDIGAATVTSVTAWRWWDWGANNDRDYTSLPIQNLQRIPSRQDQYSQELRIASDGENAIDYVAGLYAYTQTITGDQNTQYGALATYWLLGPAPTYSQNLLDGYTLLAHSRFRSDSFAGFGETTWHATSALALTAGLRYTYEDKFGSFNSTTVGGATPLNATENTGKLSIARPQSYVATVNGGSLAGRLSASYDITDDIMAYATASVGSKSGGINMSGLPLSPAGQPALATAVIKPEKNTTYEIGVKSQFFDDALTVNVDVFDTTVKDFQTNVVDNAPGAIRGYLANAEQVSVRGAELDTTFNITENFAGRFGASWTESRYDSFTNGGCPLERIGSATTSCDLTGKPLSGLPTWAVTAGGEYHMPMAIGDMSAEGYIRADASYRGDMYGEPTDSQYAIIDGYTIVNASIGLRDLGPWEVQVWARNLFDEDYMLNLTVQAGNSGLILGTPSEPRIVGATLRYSQWAGGGLAALRRP